MSSFLEIILLMRPGFEKKQKKGILPNRGTIQFVYHKYNSGGSHGGEP